MIRKNPAGTNNPAFHPNPSALSRNDPLALSYSFPPHAPHLGPQAIGGQGVIIPGPAGPTGHFWRVPKPLDSLWRDQLPDLGLEEIEKIGI